MSAGKDPNGRSLEEILGGKSLIVVSNREPYVHKKHAGSIKVEQPAGGLTAAIDDVMRRLHGVWVAWGSGSADRESVDEHDTVAVPPDEDSYRLKRVWLTPSEVENYYHGFSNRVLWPLCHFALDKIYFRKKYWSDYKRVNRRFAECISEMADENSLVWVHDYHLCLVPALLREMSPKLVISQFWHIPWPNYSVLRASPHMNELLLGLLACDSIGFQIELFVKNFMECAREALGATIDYKNNTVTYNGHTTRLRAFPISIDYDKFDSIASEPDIEPLMKSLIKSYGLNQEFVGVGIDRLEYTKGLLKRLEALDLFFSKYKNMRGRFTFVQIAVPTRTQEPYLSYKRSLEDYIEKINRKYSKAGWLPIIYLEAKLSHKELVAFYRLADLAIISSIYDGMNLVAKEFIASQVDEKGVLLLSEFCGASEELEGAILLNPYDTEGFAGSIKRALLMSPDEKASRMKSLRNQTQHNNIGSWINTILNEMAAIYSLKEERVPYVFDHVQDIPTENVMLFLDFDGTLTPIMKRPEDVELPGDIRDVLEALKGRFPIAIISGRSLKDLRQRVGVQGVIYAGNHGAEIWDGHEFMLGGSFDTKLLKTVQLKLRPALSSIENVRIEDKLYSLSIHYREVEENQVGELHNIFWNVMERFEDDFRVTSGKKVLEIRPKGMWNKGDVVTWLADRFGEGRNIIYVGDDVTDEHAYRAIKGKGTSISIGGSPEADYYLNNQGETGRLLELFDRGKPEGNN